MCSSGNSGNITASEQTYLLVEPFYTWNQRQVNIKGKGAMPVYLLVTRLCRAAGMLLLEQFGDYNCNTALPNRTTGDASLSSDSSNNMGHRVETGAQQSDDAGSDRSSDID